MQVSEKLEKRLTAQFGQIVSGVGKTFISVIRKSPEQYEGPSIENEPDRARCLVVYLSQDPPQGGWFRTHTTDTKYSFFVIVGRLYLLEQARHVCIRRLASPRVA